MSRFQKPWLDQPQRISADCYRAGYQARFFSNDDRTTRKPRKELLSLPMKMDRTVKSLKKEINRVKGIPIFMQQLLHETRVLDNGATGLYADVVFQ